MSYRWDRFLNGHPDDRHLDVKGVMADIDAFVAAAENAGTDRSVLMHFVLRWCSALFLEDAMPIKGLLSRNIRERWLLNPESFREDVRQLWKELAAKDIPLFDDENVPTLTTEQLKLLLTVTDRDWEHVEPLILGSLVEGTMNRGKRSSLGAHFTPRVYVERVVRPTMEEPLRNDLDAVRSTVRSLLEQGDADAARTALTAYHEKLCSQRVLDPACGAGNFLLVALDTLKRIEADVITLWNELGGEPLNLSERTVAPKQLYGIDIEPLSCEVTKVVLWIGQLRWARRFGTLAAAPAPPPLVENSTALSAEAPTAPIP